jgi:prepilin-type N-terminal cleavage/methylation domain-containing protein
MLKLKFKKNEKGMSFIEVLVAVSIFAIVGVTYTTALGTNVKVLLMADQRTTAESLAKTQLEAINNASYNATYPLPSNPYGTMTADGYDIKYTVELINPETGSDNATDFGVQKITCNVTGNYPPYSSVVIQSYKR